MDINQKQYLNLYRIKTCSVKLITYIRFIFYQNFLVKITAKISVNTFR